MVGGAHESGGAHSENPPPVGDLKRGSGDGKSDLGTEEGDMRMGERGSTEHSNKRDTGTRAWSAIAARTLARRDDTRVSEEEVARLQEVLGEGLIFDDDKVEAARAKWNLALIGKLLGRNVDSEHLARVLRRKWCPKGDLEIIPAINGFITFRFSNEEDFQKVRTGGPWSVSGAVLALERWREHFKPNRDSIEKATVWLRLPGLPTEYWEREFVLQIARRAGVPIAVDINTEERSKGAFARVCIEVDLKSPLVPGTMMGTKTQQFFQEFIYEGIGVYCYRCGMVGHRLLECPLPESGGTKRKIAMLVDDWEKLQVIHPSQAVAVKPVGEGVVNGCKTVEAEVTTELYGPWLTVTNRKASRRRYGDNGGVVQGAGSRSVWGGVGETMRHRTEVGTVLSLRDGIVAGGGAKTGQNVRRSLSSGSRVGVMVSRDADQGREISHVGLSNSKFSVLETVAEAGAPDFGRVGIMTNGLDTSLQNRGGRGGILRGRGGFRDRVVIPGTDSISSSGTELNGGEPVISMELGATIGSGEDPDLLMEEATSEVGGPDFAMGQTVSQATGKAVNISSIDDATVSAPWHKVAPGLETAKRRKAESVLGHVYSKVKTPVLTCCELAQPNGSSRSSSKSVP